MAAEFEELIRKSTPLWASDTSPGIATCRTARPHPRWYDRARETAGVTPVVRSPLGRRRCGCAWFHGLARSSPQDGGEPPGHIDLPAPEVPGGGHYGQNACVALTFTPNTSWYQDIGTIARIRASTRLGVRLARSGAADATATRPGCGGPFGARPALTAPPAATARGRSAGVQATPGLARH